MSIIYNWKNAKSFVKKMYEMLNKEKEGSKEKESEKNVLDFLPICQLYNDVIKNYSCWNYYEKDEEELIIPSFEQLFSWGPNKGNNTNYDFICKLLIYSEKLKGASERSLNELKEKENKSDDRELKGRLRHIVSLFFWGHVLCQNIPEIKIQIERQFNQFVAKKMFKESDSVQQSFSFMWFLLCIFHDFGYAYEKNLILNTGVGAMLEMPDDFIPEIYSTENIEKYAKYRRCKFGCKDHGIYGGKVFYNEMLEIGKLIADNDNLNTRFETEGVDKIYQYAAWIISCHNIFYNNGKDRFTECYKCMGLDDFVKSKARCLTLVNNPLLFLFCLADSIEPTKTLTSIDGNSDYELCKELRIGFKKEENLMKFDLSNIASKEVLENYKKNIKGLDEWLIDVSDDLTLKFR